MGPRQLAAVSGKRAKREGVADEDGGARATREGAIEFERRRVGYDVLEAREKAWVEDPVEREGEIVGRVTDGVRQEEDGEPGEVGGLELLPQRVLGKPCRLEVELLQVRQNREDRGVDDPRPRQAK